MPRLFARKYENFKCAHCGSNVIGNGYTDHCPKCLYSIHVDKNPGDRQSDCKGLMVPVKADIDRKGTFTISYLCIGCGMKKKFKAAPQDSAEKLAELSGSKI